MYDLAWVRSLTREQLPAASLELASLQCAIAARLAEAGDKAPASDTLLTASELGRVLHLNESWIRNQQRAGKIPSVKCGRYVRFRIADVAAALEAKP